MIKCHALLDATFRKILKTPWSETSWVRNFQVRAEIGCFTVSYLYADFVELEHFKTKYLKRAVVDLKNKCTHKVQLHKTIIV